eukprot:CAMPEP_0114241414 /NCGR_PEP_ID=MMETSP0058-20121206/9619_1 /TAXON_ID=36894 /ORGANISM="Pyramimonas parkeae, CCMP726" /LENGTH=247 /DNA_ID=CAMNT_0001353937 /DNA_START=421 /DNA_END=1164 /DNA_ORIENTATION=-
MLTMYTLCGDGVQIAGLAKLSRLQRLSLANNPLKDVEKQNARNEGMITNIEAETRDVEFDDIADLEDEVFVERRWEGILFQDRREQVEDYLGIRSVTRAFEDAQPENRATALNPQASPFGKLEILNLENTSLHQWEDLESLNTFSALKELRLSGAQLFADLGHAERRQNLIACLPKVLILDGSYITPGDKESAERSFVRFWYDKIDPPPQYQRLVEVHGVLEPLVEVDLSSYSTFREVEEGCIEAQV